MLLGEWLLGLFTYLFIGVCSKPWGSAPLSPALHSPHEGAAAPLPPPLSRAGTTAPAMLSGSPTYCPPARTTTPSVHRADSSTTTTTPPPPPSRPPERQRGEPPRRWGPSRISPVPAPPPTLFPGPGDRKRRGRQGRKSRRAANRAVGAAILWGGQALPAGAAQARLSAPLRQRRCSCSCHRSYVHPSAVTCLVLNKSRD